MQLFERRKKCTKGREEPIMSALNEKFMSDEETDFEDGSMLVRRTVTWRSEKLSWMNATYSFVRSKKTPSQ
jgi:hypothetical protein